MLVLKAGTNVATFADGIPIPFVSSIGSVGSVGVRVTVTASDGVTVKSKLTPTPEVPMPLGVVRLTLDIVGNVRSILNVELVAPALSATPATLRDVPAMMVIPIVPSPIVPGFNSIVLVAPVPVI